MPDPPNTENEFLRQLTKVVGANLPDEQFGVSELAQAVGMSRSNLLRKVKKMTGLSVSQFVRQERLMQAMELLKQPGLTVSEVAFQVGFSSTSYFIKCFREHYGYPPGAAGEKGYDESEARPSGQTHRLVAIMFTDIQGYTALMQQDEEKALQYRSRHREVFNAITEKYHGKILQYYGDGTLSIFQSAIDAVHCGIELQQAFQLQPKLPVRVGVHSGDIIITEEDIIGDGVNVASRVESLAAAGSVFISEKVYDEVKNQPGIRTVSMGSFAFKNVLKPLEVFAISNSGLVVPERGQLTGKLQQPAGSTGDRRPGKNRALLRWLLPVMLLLVAGYLLVRTGVFNTLSLKPVSAGREGGEKSIAVLPFINDSNDSSNVYIINGLMESILDHLQRLDGLRVISRTSVERYRNTGKTIPEIAEELDVRYFVEGSGQKIGDQLVLSIQLIEASSDRHLWSEQFNRETSDIFGLQREVAKKIADKIQVIITPETAAQLEKVPTDNLEAYEAFLKGRECFNHGLEDRTSFSRAIPYYEQAIALDPEFARAYAGLAIAYYLLDYDQAEKHYADQINRYADKAMLYDPRSPQCLVAKALFYLYTGAYTSALPHLEKALEYSPNSPLVINILADFYTRFVPNTEKYLEYALRGIRIDIASHDSTTASFIYLHVSNALIQSGFQAESERFINRSLAYDPNNLYSAYVKAFILYTKHRDLATTRAQLLEAYQRDTTRLDILQELGKISYFMRDYPAAYRYYKRFADARTTLGLDIYPEENAKIAAVMRQMGKPAEAERYIQAFQIYTENDQSIYQPLNRAMLAAYEGDPERAVEQVRQFSKAENYHYWTVLFLELDPLMDSVKKLPGFQKSMRVIEKKFRERQDALRERLKDLL
ncbi:MAG: helix-turn-helix domain-containing protein [Bacteroidetes bacterium]|nr:MAG: helix-turn-helix domain-containing protein [Bacteroidota bacterium]